MKVFLIKIFLFAILSPILAKADSPEPFPLKLEETLCDTIDVVQVCRHHTEGASAALTIEYQGRLNRYEPVSVWIKLNGRAETYKMKSSFGKSTLLLTNGAIECSLCSAEPRPDAVTCPGPWFSDHWICTEAPREMKDLFYWAVDNQGRFNDWDIEVAFVSGSDWDSLYGLNYRFHLPN